MRRFFAVALVIIVVLGGLLLAKKMRAPKAPPPTTQEIWAAEGIPVETARITRGDMEQVVEVTGNIDALKKVILSAKISGRVAGVYAREGEPISAGITVIALDREDALSNLRQARAGLQSALARLSQAKTNARVTKIQTDSAIEQAKSALEAAQARLRVVKEPSRSQEVMVAENRVASAKANLDSAEADFKRGDQLLKKGAIAESSYDVLKAKYVVAQQDYESSQEQLSLIREGGRREDVMGAQAQVDVAKEQLRSARANSSQNLLREEDVKTASAAVEQARAIVALAEQQLSYTYVNSPIAGTLADRRTEPGQVVAAGAALARVVNLGSLYFEGSLSETEFINIHQGQPVRVSVDAIPGRVFKGMVDRVYPAESTESRNFPVRIKIIERTHEIRPGMFARGEIVTGFDSNVLLVPKDAVEERRGTKMVFVVGPKDTVKRVDIEVARENRHVVEIKTPTELTEGDVVVTQGRQNLQDKKKVLLGK